MKKTLKPVELFLAVGLVATLAACTPPSGSNGGEGGEGGEGAAIPADLLPTFADNVVIPTYVELVAQSKNLSASVAAFVANPTPDSLAATQTIWTNARFSWEQGEAFTFGPAEALGDDGSLDDWPVNEADVQAVLDSSDVITDEYVEELPAIQKGYHVMEMLLFGKTADKTVDAFTPRELEFLGALAQNFERTANELLTRWVEGVDGNPAYREVLVSAGKSSNSAYPTVNVAAEEIVQGIIGALEEVRDEKIEASLTSKDVSEFERQFSQTTLNDWRNNIISAQSAYLGMRPDGRPPETSLSQVVAAIDVSLDTDIKIQFDTALSMLDTASSPLEEALTEGAAQDALTQAQDAILVLHETFENDVLPMI